MELGVADRDRRMEINVERTEQQGSAGPRNDLRQGLAIQNGAPKATVGEPVARVKHEGCDRGNDDQTGPGRNAVDPDDDRVDLLRQSPPVIVEDEGRDDLGDEEDVFGGPGEDERADQDLRGQRRSQPDRPPDSHARDRAEDDGQEDEELGMPFQVGQVIAVPGPIGVRRLDGQEQPAPTA